MNIAKRQKTEEVKSDVSLIIINDSMDECLPIRSLEELNKWNPVMKKHKTISFQKRVSVKNCPKTLVCHDMKGGYLEDRFINGSNTEDNFYFLHWSVIDIFVYFSHYLITIPPCGWITAAHKNGVKILGTFITEWEEGAKVCAELFKDEDTIERLCSQLVKMTEYYNFDGWLINIENKLQVCQIPLLKKFIKMLTGKMHFCNKESEVIWYDSVLEDGDLKWQNALNEKNRIFFDSCDGIFLNYNWTKETLQQTANLAGERKVDVYVGVDVFGRGCPGGGGFCTDFAVTEARNYDLSVAIFAPGWIYECLNVKDFKLNQFKFWNALQNLCLPRAIQTLPYCTSFCPGFGKKLFKNGKIIREKAWFNVSLQHPQPIYYSGHSSDKTSITISEEDAFNGGGCICLKVNADSKNEVECFNKITISYFRLLKTCFTLEEDLIISYIFKPLSANIKVSMVLRMKNSEESSNFYLGDEKNDIKDPFYILPASKNDMQRIHYNMSENPTKLENWVKRLYILKSTNFKNLSIEDISIAVTSTKNETSCVLLGEIEILPLQPKLNCSYKNLIVQHDKDNITVQCTLEWDYYPSIIGTDLFYLVKNEKKHFCRTSQFYYDLKYIIKEAVEVEIILSFHCSENQYFSDTSLKIPIFPTSPSVE